MNCPSWLKPIGCGVTWPSGPMSIFGLTQGGVTHLAKTDTEMARYADWLPHAAANDVDTRLLNASEVADLIPGMSRSYAGALHTASDMRAEPWVAVPALAGVAVRAGATIVENCAVRALDIQAGRVAGVVTEQRQIAAPEVVLAGGAWSSLLLRRHGISLPQLSVRATVAATEALPMVFPGGAADDGDCVSTAQGWWLLLGCWRVSRIVHWPGCVSGAAEIPATIARRPFRYAVSTGCTAWVSRCVVDVAPLGCRWSKPVRRDAHSQPDPQSPQGGAIDQQISGIVPGYWPRADQDRMGRHDRHHA